MSLILEYILDSTRFNIFFKSVFLSQFTFEKTFADNLLTPCHPRCPCHSFFSRKEMKVFDENIPAFFSIYCTSVGTKRFKVQKTVSRQTVQRALNDSRR